MSKIITPPIPEKLDGSGWIEFGSGTEKRVYEHPDYPDVILKLDSDSRTPELATWRGVVSHPDTAYIARRHLANVLTPAGFRIDDAPGYFAERIPVPEGCATDPNAWPVNSDYSGFYPRPPVESYISEEAHRIAEILELDVDNWNQFIHIPGRGIVFWDYGYGSEYWERSSDDWF